MRAPLPPQGSEPWYPSRELLGALDPQDAAELVRELKLARADFWRAIGLALVMVALGVGAFWAAWTVQPLEALLSCILFVIVRLLALSVREDAERTKGYAYRNASRALEAKLAADEKRTFVRRLVTKRPA